MAVKYNNVKHTLANSFIATTTPLPCSKHESAGVSSVHKNIQSGQWRPKWAQRRQTHHLGPIGMFFFKFLLCFLYILLIIFVKYSSIYTLKTHKGLGWVMTGQSMCVFFFSGGREQANQAQMTHQACHLGQKYVFFFLSSRFCILINESYNIQVLSIILRHEVGQDRQRRAKQAQMIASFGP